MGAKIDQGDLRRILGKIEGVEKIVAARENANALTTVAREVRNEAIKRTKQEVPSLRASRIRSAIKLRRATPSRQTATIDIERKPANLINYGARVTSKGVSVVVSGARKVINGAFIVGGKFVARRRGKKRLPIESLPGPSVGGVLKKHVDDLLKLARQDLREKIATRVRRTLRK